MSEEEEAAAKVEGSGNERGVLGIFLLKMLFVPLRSVLSLVRALCRCKREVGTGGLGWRTVPLPAI